MLQLRQALKTTFFLISLIPGLHGVLKAQDVYFSQFFLNPVYMNPSYAGTMKVPRAGVQYRNQWPSMNKAYTTYFASYDTYLPKITSGVGLLIFNDVQGNGIYTESSFKFVYSKEIKLSRDWTMYGSLSAGAQINSLNFSRLIFSDGLDPIYGNHQPTAETEPDSNNRIFPDFGAGILVFNDKYFLGLASDHLSEPDQSIYSGYSQILPRKYTFHMEVNLPWFKPGHLRKYCTFNPNVIIQSQGNEHNVTMGLYANRRGFSLGLWGRQTTLKSSDAIVMVGFIGKLLKTAVTYDTSIHGVGLQSHGAFEISISYLLKDPGKKSIFPFYEIPGDWDIR
jgi:type IX secretion system PorP/SprF family membrane protein